MRMGYVWIGGLEIHPDKLREAGWVPVADLVPLRDAAAQALLFAEGWRAQEPLAAVVNGLAALAPPEPLSEESE